MRRLILLPFVILTLLMVASPALAFLTAPTSMSFPSVKVFRYLVESGDVAVIFEYKCEYSTYPDTYASNSLIFKMFNGADLLNTDSPYPYRIFENNGYWGVGLFYFSAADNLTWGSAYTLTLQQLPAYYDPAASVNRDINVTDYCAETTQLGNQQALYDYVMEICDRWHEDYLDGMTTPISLKTATDMSIVLSAYGEAYFVNALPGLQTMCPQLFAIQTYVPTTLPVTSTYDMSLGNTYGGRMSGSDIQRGANRIGVYFSISGYFVLGIFIFIVAIIPPIWTQRKNWGLEPGLAISAVIVIASSILIGNTIFALVMIGTLVAAIALVYVLILKRA